MTRVTDTPGGFSGGDEGGETAAVIAQFKGGQLRSRIGPGHDKSVFVDNFYISGLSQTNGLNKAPNSRTRNVDGGNKRGCRQSRIARSGQKHYRRGGNRIRY